VQIPVSTALGLSVLLVEMNPHCPWMARRCSRIGRAAGRGWRTTWPRDERYRRRTAQRSLAGSGLGAETSLPLAERLPSSAWPFRVLTGYRAMRSRAVQGSPGHRQALTTDQLLNGMLALVGKP